MEYFFNCLDSYKISCQLKAIRFHFRINYYFLVLVYNRKLLTNSSGGNKRFKGRMALCCLLLKNLLKKTSSWLGIELIWSRWLGRLVAVLVASMRQTHKLIQCYWVDIAVGIDWAVLFSIILDVPSLGLPPCRGRGACVFPWSWELCRWRRRLWQVQPNRKDQRGDTRPKCSHQVHTQLDN